MMEFATKAKSIKTTLMWSRFVFGSILDRKWVLLPSSKLSAQVHPRLLARSLAVTLLITVSAMTALAKPKDVEDVIIVNEIPTTMTYNWWVDGKSSVSCSGNSCSGYFRPADGGTAQVGGAVLKLLRHDGTIVIVECLPQERNVADTLTLISGINASKTYRSCRMPSSASKAAVHAEFHLASVKLSFAEASAYDSGKLASETYLIRGFLHPKPSSEIMSVSSFQTEEGDREIACGPAKESLKVHTQKDEHPLASPDSAHALVYIIQQDEFSVIMWGSFPTKYGLDGTWVGGNSSDSYFYFPASPGEHHLCGEWQLNFPHHARPVSLAKIELKAGESYFFRARVIFASGNGQRSIDLEPLKPEEGQLLIAKSALSETRLK